MPTTFVSLGDTIAGYLDLRYRMDPVSATAAGRDDLDGELARYDAASMRQYAAALRSYAAALEEAEADTVDDAIDQTAALHAVRHDLLRLERERRFARDPSLHLAHALNGIFLLLIRPRADAVRRAASLLARLRAMPAFFEAAAKALTEPRAVFVETARLMLPGALALVEEGIAESDVDLTPLDPSELDEARVGAAEALRQFNDFLAEAAARAKEDFAIGLDLFERKVHTAHMIQETAPQLARYGERLRGETVAELERLAAQIAPGVPWRELAARLAADVPPREAVLAEYAEAMEAARDFVASRRLAAVPEGELRVVPTPDFLRALVPFACYVGPGPFDEDQTGLFFVTVPEPGEEARMNCRAELALTALHEGVPGHHLQVLTANALERPARRVLTSPAGQEGWALYGETLMADEGFLPSPEERFCAARHLLWRALRVILDVGLHTGGMTIAAATAMLRDELGMPEGAAAAEVRRYCAYPTYQLCYALGRREMLALREDVRRARGASFSLADFHAELLRYGGLPPALARWGMGA